ncbi:TIGR02302 family protein [Methylocella sp.]|uniref:TIGR02302 family protein n=1 Tax=Methylocella sp. TaxID=1978226 RepID=UPI0035ADA10F
MSDDEANVQDFGRPAQAGPPHEDDASARFERLVRRARAVLLFERLWRLAAPVLIVVGLFLIASFLGLWLEAPRFVRPLGLAVFILALAFALWPARKLRLPTRAQAISRIDRASGLKARPAAALDDRLGNSGEDPATAALWRLHRRRALGSVRLMRAGAPSPRVVDLDRRALRAAVLVGLVAAAFVAGPQRYARTLAAFDWRLSGVSGASARVDAWVDPPPYTGHAPIMLTPADARPARIAAPVGSAVVIRASNGAPAYRAAGALEEAPREPAAAGKAQPPRGPGGEARLILRGDAGLAIEGVGAFDFAAIPDRPPTIALAAVPRPNARGTLVLRYRVSDDYGAALAEAQFADPVAPDGKPSVRSLVEAPHPPLQLPPVGAENGEAETTVDLSEHPWAGARVRMTLMARDEGGNEGRSEPFVLVLPQRPFVKPLARALVEQRRNLVLNPDDKGRVLTALDALMIEPEAFGTNAGVYLGLRVAMERLAAASRDAELLDVADYLWGMALQIEDGDLSEAERDLRAAQQALREALQRGASPEEIKKLADDLRAAMDKFLQEFAERQRKEQGEEERDDARQGPGRAVSEKELQAMLDRMQDMAQNGDAEQAQRMLDEMQNILENLKTAQRGRMSPQAREMSRALGELDRLSREQQDLRDDTRRSGESTRRRERGGLGEFSTQRRADEDRAGADDGERSDAEPSSQADLQRRQEELRRRVEALQKRLEGAGEAGAEAKSGLGDAREAMREAQESLGRGPRGQEPAEEAQGRALDGLREGAQKLAQALREQGEGGQGSGGEGEGDAQGAGQGQYGQDGTDPLGRRSGRERAFNPNAKYDPLGAPPTERARRVLEELRRRLGEPSRPREELDYLERLLRRY